MRGYTTRSSVLTYKLGGTKQLQAYRAARRWLKRKFPGDWKRNRSMKEWVEEAVEKTIVP